MNGFSLRMAGAATGTTGETTSISVRISRPSNSASKRVLGQKTAVRYRGERTALATCMRATSTPMATRSCARIANATTLERCDQVTSYVVAGLLFCFVVFVQSLLFVALVAYFAEPQPICSFW